MLYQKKGLDHTQPRRQLEYSHKGRNDDTYSRGTTRWGVEQQHCEAGRSQTGIATCISFFWVSDGNFFFLSLSRTGNFYSPNTSLQIGRRATSHSDNPLQNRNCLVQNALSNLTLLHHTRNNGWGFLESLSIKLDVKTPLLKRFTLKQLHNVRQTLCTEWKGIHRSPLCVSKQGENGMLVVIFHKAGGRKGP